MRSEGKLRKKYYLESLTKDKRRNKSRRPSRMLRRQLMMLRKLPSIKLLSKSRESWRRLRVRRRLSDSL